MRIAIGQINVHVGAIDGNTAEILARIQEARGAGCDLVVFPELAVCGCSPLDLVWRDGFVTACRAALDRVVAASAGIGVILGTVAADPGQRPVRSPLSPEAGGGGVRLYNRAMLIEDREVLGHVDKQTLLSHDTTCEPRYFTPGEGTSVHAFRGTRLGISIGDDAWIEDGPSDLQASLGAEWIVNVSASPFSVGVHDARRRVAARRAKENAVGIVFANLVGGQDDVVFDGGSFILDAKGRAIFQAPRFREGLYVVDVDRTGPVPREPSSDIADIRAALVLGVRDYVRKNGFERVIVGTSGGIDSAVAAALAVEALGAAHVLCVYLPSEFSSESSREDAQAVSDRLGTEFQVLEMSQAHHALRAALPVPPTGLADENLQPRVRATLLMALANQQEALVLCPGNKSEIAMGYNTLYGDTAGALAPIADLYKRQVRDLAASFGDLIPERVRTKAPSAELRAHQRDEDDLPPYEVLDPLLQQVIENGASKRRLLDEGFDEATVDDVLRRLRVSEYKRQQLPPGIKVSTKAFGAGRRMPLTNGYAE